MKRSRWNTDLASYVQKKKKWKEKEKNEKKKRKKCFQTNDARASERVKKHKNETEKTNLLKEKLFDLGKVQ